MSHEVEERKNILDAEQFTVRVGVMTVDVRKALPLTMGDWETLEREGVTTGTLGDSGGHIAEKVRYLSYVLRKVNPDITVEDVRAMTDAAYAEALEKISAYVKTARPNSASSTRSPSSP